MEVSNEIKEDIRKTQTELKNAIRVHQVKRLYYFVIRLLIILVYLVICCLTICLLSDFQVWVARLQDDENVCNSK